MTKVDYKGAHSPSGDQARNTITLDSKGVVVIVLRGRQSAQSIREISRQAMEIVTQQRAQANKVPTLCDVRALGLRDVPSDARLETKRLMSIATDATAIVGGPGLMALVMYMHRIAGQPNRRYFTSMRQARNWLEGKRGAKGAKPASSLVAGVAMLLIGVSVLAGWATNDAYLMRWIPHLRPMNPAAALGLVVASVGFCCYWLDKLKALKATGIVGILLGVAALLGVPIDTLLFGDQVRALGVHAYLADSAAICFIAIGLSPFTIGITGWWRRPLQYLIALVLLGLGLFTMFGQLYAYDFMYGISPSFVMAFNLAAAFTLAGIGLVLLVLYRKTGQSIFGQVTRVGWLLVAALVLVQIATYGAWRQSIDRNSVTSLQEFNDRIDNVQAALQERLAAYINTLYGFKGLFAASDYVDQGEFEKYYDSQQVSQNYPGLRALSFISRVQEKDLSTFTQIHKNDKSLHAQGNPSFVITNKAATQTHYILTYVANSTTAGGSDLASRPDRLKAFRHAEATGRAVSSGTVTFAATATAPEQKGFFLTIPVESKTGAGVPTGFVNAVFNYNDFFGKAFTGKNQLEGRSLKIVDAADGSVVYGGHVYDSHNSFQRTVSIAVADRQWNMVFAAPPTYGVSASQAEVPRMILWSGQIFSALLLVIFFILLRSRRQGYLLAKSITEDLQRERNAAVANNQKSTAILESIGDAVFAIDIDRRIQLFNPAAQRISGYTAEEALGKPYEEILKFEFEKTGKVNRSFIAEALSGRLASMANHTVLIRKDGRRVQVADSAAPIHNAKGRITGAIVVFRDVSKDYELDKAKSEFVSLASHQLRTPLSAINWFSEMLLDGDGGKLNKTQHEYLQEIFDGNKRMIELVDSLLDVSRLEVGKLPNKPEPVDLAQVVESLEKELASSIQGKHMTYTKHAVKLPQITVDPKQVRMIVQNLMSNAVKYTPPKSTVHVELRPATAEEVRSAKLHTAKDYLLFSVQDNGYGIPKAQQARIFGKLFRADNVRALDVEGTGLGLYIVKEVVQKMGGRVWFESMESVGTTFFVLLPLDPKSAK